MRAPQPVTHPPLKEIEGLSPEKIIAAIKQLEKEMLQAAERLEFELAAALRDEIRTLKKRL